MSQRDLMVTTQKDKVHISYRHRYTVQQTTTPQFQLQNDVPLKRLHDNIISWVHSIHKTNIHPRQQIIEVVLNLDEILDARLDWEPN